MSTSFVIEKKKKKYNSKMSSPDFIKAAEVIAVSVAGLALIYHGGKLILKSLGLFYNSNKGQGGDRSARPSSSMGSSQDSNRDKRPVGRPVQHSGTRHRRRPQ